MEDRKRHGNYYSGLGEWERQWKLYALDDFRSLGRVKNSLFISSHLSLRMMENQAEHGTAAVIVITMKTAAVV